MSYYYSMKHSNTVYFKRWKHMPENWKICRIRRLIWRAQCFKTEGYFKSKGL